MGTRSMLETRDTPWHALSAAEAARRLKTSPDVGLPSEEAERRLLRHGPNAIPAEGKRSLGALLLRRLGRPAILVVFVALGIVACFGWRTDVAALATVVLLKVAVLTAREAWAVRTIERCRRLGALAVRGYIRVPKAREGRASDDDHHGA